jgi:hypothetical protein
VDEADRAPVRGAAGDYDSALRWYGKVFQESPTERLSLEQLIRLADKLDRWADLASLLSNYLEGELGEEPAVIDIVRRTAEIFDHRLGQRPRRRSTTGGCSTRVRTIVTSRSCSKPRWNAGARGRSCAS